MHVNTQTTETISPFAQLLDKHLWNEQTEVVDTLFPDAEESHPEAARWFELKDSTPDNIKSLQARGAAILRLGTHAWIGLPADPVFIAHGINELMQQH